MEKVGQLYRKYRNYIEDGLFIIVLVFYPLLKINQGLDVSDTSYSLANFQYFPSAKGTWMVATYLANVVGWSLMQLPKGNTLTGMYFYTGLIVSFTALLFYFALRKRMPAWIVFAGEMLALSLCWSPTTALYHYLTYSFMGVGILLLYRGICTGQEKTLFFAGICLGANITVRMPNVVQASFILALWYAAWMKREKFVRTLKDTGICLLGYVIGFGIPFLFICGKYGMSAYPKMIQTMFAMTDKATDYKPAAMVSEMFGGYGKGIYWLIFAGICIGFLYLMYVIKKKLLPQNGTRLYQLLCILVYCVLIRFYWGRGMFNFEYYYYGSIYEWADLFVLVTIVCAVFLLINRKYRVEDKILALIILIQIFIGPLGSNNALYTTFNNLFLAAPFTLCVCYGWFIGTKGKEIHFPWKCLLSVLGLMVFVQSFGFHAQFVFSDGIWGEKRDTLMTGIPKAEGIYTSDFNAAAFSELVQYANKQQFAGREVILYGDIPGLSYFLDMPAAISTCWPDLDSYRLVRLE
ncbi:MAG: hypothetical protein K2J04_03450, partial [Lachnospiraceae bacterium]|nr:hypothetical protein [Lachnospiraceae bacterium]